MTNFLIAEPEEDTMTNPNELDKWITTTKAAETMNVTREYVQKLCKQYIESQGEEGIKAKRPGREYWVWREDAESWTRTRKKSE